MVWDSTHRPGCYQLAFKLVFNINYCNSHEKYT
jgi:hypothetical protein